MLLQEDILLPIRYNIIYNLVLYNLRIFSNFLVLVMKYDHFVIWHSVDSKNNVKYIKEKPRVHQSNIPNKFNKKYNK